MLLILTSKSVVLVIKNVISKWNWSFKILYVEFAYVSMKECKKTEFAALRVSGAVEGLDRVVKENDSNSGTLLTMLKLFLTSYWQK